ncbi:hypothetical protein BGZ80_005811, partial [Entomortierella chlamydospora]
MASVNPYDLLNDDAQDQEIQVPAVKKDSVKPAAKTASKTAPKPATASSASKPADNRGPRKDGPRTSNKPRDSD